MNSISPRLSAIVKALPLKPGMRVLEVGCGPGAAARSVAQRIAPGYVLGIDRSAKAISQAIDSSQTEISSGILSFRKVAIENFELQSEEESFHLAFAIRVGALDGRHPEINKEALLRISQSLVKGGLLFIDGGNPLVQIPLHRTIVDDHRKVKKR